MSPSTRTSDAAVEVYAARLLQEVARRLAGRRPFDADDIASGVVALFLADAARVMAAHPDPAAYARLAAKRAAIAYERHQRVQRGEGARLVIDGEGGRAPQRIVVSVDRPVGDGPARVSDHLADPAGDPADLVVERCDVLARLAPCVADLAPADRHVLVQVDALGHTVSEVAERLGQRRETVSRRLNRARREVRRRAALLPVG